MKNSDYQKKYIGYAGEGIDYYVIFKYFHSLEDSALVSQARISIADLEAEGCQNGSIEKAKKICIDFDRNEYLNESEKLKLALFCATV